MLQLINCVGELQAVGGGEKFTLLDAFYLFYEHYLTPDLQREVVNVLIGTRRLTACPKLVEAADRFRLEADENLEYMILEAQNEV